VVRVRREFLHIRAEIFRARNSAKLLFPLALDPRRFGGVAEERLLVGGNVIADGSERDAHKENGCNCGGAIHYSPRTKGVFCLKTERLEMRESKLTITLRLATFSGEDFGHENVMAGNLGGHVRSEKSGAGFEVAEVAIKSGKGRARADDTEVNRDAAGLAEKVLRGIH